MKTWTVDLAYLGHAAKAMKIEGIVATSRAEAIRLAMELLVAPDLWEVLGVECHE